ncbi:MAG: site-2 protease family protein [Victivallales bacterium]|nr:site-2 protease family protein [Victivallales bacterium]
MAYFLEILEIAGCVLFVVFFLGFCVFIHELGHFLTAKFCGLHINAFSIGFKKAWGKKINGVDYRIGWLPFGGYVDIPQIDSTSVPHTEDGKELPPAKPVHRLLSAFMGPFFNILFGLALGCAVWYFGVPEVSPKMREIIVASVDKSGPEYQAGLRENDRIIKVNGEKFYCSWNDFIKKLLFSIGKVELTVKRGDKVLEINYVPRQNPNAPERMKFEKMPWPFFEARIPILLYPEKNSPAAKAGIESGDMLVSLNGKPLYNRETFWFTVNYCEGKELNIVVERNGKNIKLPPVKPELDKETMERNKDFYMIGVSFSPDLQIREVRAGYPASLAGIKAGDIVEAINGKKVSAFPAFHKELLAAKNTPVAISVRRGEKPLNFTMVPVKPNIYSIGISIMILDHPTPWQQFVNVVDMSFKSLRGLAVNLLNAAGMTEQQSAIKYRNLSGPIGLATTLYESVKLGTFRYGLYFVVLVSFALAIFNLLPLPVLDGGHMALALIEMIIRKPLHEGVVRALTTVFIFLLIFLMIYVSYFDILRRLPKKWQQRLDPDAGSSRQTVKEDPGENLNGGKDAKAPVKAN